MKQCVWLDLDGTIANGEHRLNHIDGEKKDYAIFYQESINDPPYEDILELVRLLETRYYIVACTGRPEHTRELTVQWLVKQRLWPAAIYMRPNDDFRHDDIIKIELLAKMRADGYDPWIALEDRNRVVKALREAGVRVLHVKDGDY